MKKSFKRVIASFLAVLMVMFAMPFSALAYGADETPNVGLIFNAFTFNNRYFNYTQNATALTNRGIKDMPLQWDSSAKQMWARKSIADAAGFGEGANATNKRYQESGDRQLQNGDYFTMTITFDNIPTIFACGAEIQYTGVEPASVYKWSYEDYNDTGETKSGLTLIPKDENTALEDTMTEAGYDYESECIYEDYAAEGLPITYISAGSTYFTNMRDLDVGASTYEDWGIAFGVAGDGCTDISSNPSGTAGVNTFKNPETGEPKYNFNYRAPLATYLFKVTDANNINFDLHNDVIYYASDIDHAGANDIYYYAPSYDQVTGEEIEGKSKAINFMGQNEYRQDVTYPTVTITTPDGYENLSYTADASTTTYAVPNLADYTKAADDDYHYTAQWKDNNVPSGTFGSADETFEIEFAQAAHTFDEGVVDPAPTCTTPGTKTYTCTVCGKTATEEVTDTNAHSWGAWAADDSTWATTTDQTVEANNSATVTFKRVCANSASHTESQNVNATVSSFTAAQEGVAGSVTFSATYEGVTATKTVELEALAHTHNYTTRQEIPNTRVASTCKTAGSYQTALYCACGEYDATSVQTENLPLDADNHENLQNMPAIAATCETAGRAAGKYCDACDTWTEGGETIPAKNHDFSGAIDITWAQTAESGENKWTASGVQHCVNDASHTQEIAVDTVYSHKDASNKEAGYDKWEAKVNGEVQDTKTETIAAAGVNITVAATDLGTVEGSIETNGSEVTKAFAFGEKYTVTAVRPAGTTFIGWQVDGKLVSTTDTYSSIAYTDLTLVPVFQEATEGKINVFFYDKYGNTIKAYKDVTVDEYQAAVAEGVPAAPTYPGYTFAGYDKSDDDIKATSTSATFTAQYEKADTTFTVNAPGATIEASEGTVDGETATVPYDAQVTVKAAGAAGWAIDGVTVAYGEEYTFYVGADVTVTPVADAEVAPIVNIINVTNNAPNYTVLATRAAGNAQIAQRGWMYGRSATDAALADIEAAKAAGLRVKIAEASTSEQFALTFKASTAGTIRIRAFIVDSRGNVYYSPIEDVAV